MDPAANVLIWWLAFAATHMSLSHPPVRAALVRRFGERSFFGLYSTLAFATFVPLCWTYFAHRETRAISLLALASVSATVWIALILMAIALILLVVGLARPSPSTAGFLGSMSATGVLRITRSPAFVSFIIFGLAHLLVNHTALDRAFFGGFVAFGVIGGLHQDWRKRTEGSEAMKSFYAETSFLPFAAIVAGRNRLVLGELPLVPIIAGLGIFVAMLWIHGAIFG